MAHLKIRKGIRIPKVVRKTLLAALILLVIAIIGGLIYSFFSEKEVKTGNSAQNPAPPKIPKILKPSTPDENARVGVAVQFIDTPVKLGKNVSLQIHTNPNATCKIVVTYADSTVSKDSGLGSKHADPYGLVNWTWTASKTAAGKATAHVTCAYKKYSGVVIGDLVVTK